MENVIVRLIGKGKGIRNVIIDGQLNGRTDQNLNIGAGTHTFTLDGPKNFYPGFIITVVDNTLVIKPKVIIFI